MVLKICFSVFVVLGLVATFTKLSSDCGEVVVGSELDELVAMACGEYPNTQGQGSCTGGISGPCPQESAWVPQPQGAWQNWGYWCTSGRDCSCTGGTDIVCGGTGKAGDLCYYQDHLCCAPATSCSTILTHTNVQMRIRTWACTCSGFPSGFFSGTRAMATVSYDDPSCLPPPTGS